MAHYKPVLLAVLDGWGINPAKKGNAVAAAKTPNMDRYMQGYPHAKLACSGEAVGLPPNTMGNSEVGHLNIGAGRVVRQDIMVIRAAIADGSFYTNSALMGAAKNCKKNNSALHIVGLFSDGLVHSDPLHLKALLDFCKRQGLKQVFIHAVLDGRDTPPKSAEKFLKETSGWMKEFGVGRYATTGGRYWYMDRDKRWDRVKKAYDAMTIGDGEKAGSVLEALRNSYAKGETDEFVKPTIIEEKGKPVALVKDNDSVIFFNYRSDRPRELTGAFVLDDFDGFKREKRPKVHFVTMTQYDVRFPVAAAFPPQDIRMGLGETLAKAGKKQLRIAETEKYAHVTFFFNGGVEKPNKGEDRILVPSPKVATYDLKPEMSAYEVTDKLLKALASEKYDVIVVNYANCDMVGHTGVFGAIVEAVQAVDKCMGRVVDKAVSMGGAAIITADHGNAEEKLDGKGCVITAHSTNPVNVVIVGKGLEKAKIRDGMLRDLSPTVLGLIGMKKPKEMDGSSLIVGEKT